jgi:hypothetical protein
MEVGQKRDIIQRLADAHYALKKSIAGLDLEQVIHEDTGWRIRDILGHIATWDRVLIHAIVTFLAGSEYVIPGMVGDETAYNEQKVEEQSQLPSAEILKEWNQAREDFIDAVQRIPEDRFKDELAFPWGDERGSLSLMIEYMIEHDGEHQDEILEALS